MWLIIMEICLKPSAFIGILIAMGLLGMILQGIITSKMNTITDDLIKECQKSLPRDQHCILKAVPIEKSGNQ